MTGAERKARRARHARLALAGAGVASNEDEIIELVADLLTLGEMRGGDARDLADLAIRHIEAEHAKEAI